MVLTLVKNRNITKMALDADTLRCQPAEQKYADGFSSTKEMSLIRTKVYLIVLSSYFNMQKKTTKISACAENHLSQEALKRGEKRI